MKFISREKQDIARAFRAVSLFSLLILSSDLLILFYHVKSIFGASISLSPSENLMMTGVFEILFHHCLLVFLFCLFVFLLTIVLRIKNYITFYVFLVFYLFTFALVRYPQIFQSTGVNSILPAERGPLFISTFGFLCVLAGIAIFLLMLNRYKKARDTSAKISIVVISFLGLLLLSTNFCSLYFPSLFKSESQIPDIKMKVANNKSIIVISVDALNVDVDDQLLKYANASFRKFLEKSELSPRTVADATQTHGSMVALFSGKRPYENGVRYPFHPLAGNRGQETFLTLLDIKNQGYGITFLRDEMVTASFFAGDVIDSVVEPETNKGLNKFSYFYSSFLTYGIFDNFIGHSIFPDAFGNLAYNFGNQLNFTVKKFNRQIERMNNSTQKEFLFFHTCVLHSPLNLPYPYYPKRGEGALDGIRFSYLSNLKPWRLDQRAAVQGEAKFNAKVYTAGLRFLTEQLLNPIFSELEVNGYLQSATIFLISDHGENLWNSHKKAVGNFALPFHGDTLLFGSKNEFSYYRVLNPIGKTSIADNQAEINLSQNFRKSLGLNFDSETVYSETAYSPLAGSYSLLRYLDYLTIQKNLSAAGDPAYLVANEYLLNPAMMQKQKAVFHGNYKLTVYPTLFGRQWFLCDYIEDPLCLRNAIDDSVAQEAKKYLVDQLQSANAVDVKNNIDSSFFTDGASESDNNWIRFRDAEVLYFRDHDFAQAHGLIQQIWRRNKDPELTRYILKTLERRCHQIDPSTEIFLRSISNTSAVSTSVENCLKDAKSFQKEDGGLEDISWKYDNINALKMYLNLPEAQEYLEALRVRYGIVGDGKISTLFLALPAEIRNQEAALFWVFIKNRLEYFFSYKLREDQDVYFFLKFYIAKALNQNVDRELLSEVVHNPTSVNFEIRFMNYLEKKNKLSISGNREKKLQALESALGNRP